MTDLRKAAEMALKTLENPWNAKPEGVADAIEALRQALAQPEWVGLTDEDKSELVHKYKHIETGWRHDADLIAETETKLKEKNT